MIIGNADCKIILLSLIALIMLSGCSKEDEPKTSYTEQQEKAFAIFKGTWADIQFSNIGEGALAHLQPDPDKIVFGIHYSEPIKVYKDDYMYRGYDLSIKSETEFYLHDRDLSLPYIFVKQ